MKKPLQSEAILRLLDASQEVEDSVTHHGPRVAKRLEERFAPYFAHLGDGRRPNFLATFFALRDELAASREELSAAELRHIDLVAKITELSLEREDLFGSLQDDYTWLRGNFARILGPRLSAAVTGVQGPTAAGTSKLLRQVKIAVDRLSKPGLELPPGPLGTAPSDPGEIAAKLAAKARRLRQVRRRLRRTRRKAELTMEEKNDTIERHKATLFPVRSTLGGFYRLAGEDGLADQILPPTPRRPRRTIELAPAPEDRTPEEPPPEDGAAEEKA
jgi:hypothetical protein